MESNCQFEAMIDADAVRRFAELSGDHNPLHLDAAYAAGTEFGKPIAHGVLLLGLVSRVLGMHIPGRRCLILSLKARFPQAVRYPALVRVQGTLLTFGAERGAGTVGVSIADVASGTTVVEAEVAFGLHTGREDAGPVVPKAEPRPGPSRAPGAHARLLVTGGTGGVGVGVVEALSSLYDITLLGRSGPPVGLTASHVGADFEIVGDLERALGAMVPSDYFGIVHMSVPPVRRGRLIDDPTDLRRQWIHAVEVPVILARWAAHESSSVRRMVLLGSTSGNKFPEPRMGAYSLAKASMDALAPLLASDLAARQITVNVVRPGFIPAGINSGALVRTVKSVAARAATGAVTGAADVAKLIAFLLSPDAAQIDGAILTVDGGILPQ